MTENTLLGERHVRYGGYGGIAYHHISDNYVALFCNFIVCGLTNGRLGAILETLGPDLLPRGMAPLSLLHTRHLTALRVPHEHRLANCLVQRATQWVTVEISTLTAYAIPQAWALAWDRNGFQGVRYAARHSASRRTYAVALFGAAGERRDWPNGRTSEITTEHIRRLRDRCGIALFETPAVDELVYVK